MRAHLNFKLKEHARARLRTRLRSERAFSPDNGTVGATSTCGFSSSAFAVLRGRPPTRAFECEAVRGIHARVVAHSTRAVSKGDRMLKVYKFHAEMKIFFRVLI